MWSGSIEIEAVRLAPSRISKCELSGLEEQVTLTATGSEQSVSSSIQAVEVIGSVDLAKKSPVSLGEALDGELGVRNGALDRVRRVL